MANKTPSVYGSNKDIYKNAYVATGSSNKQSSTPAVTKNSMSKSVYDQYDKEYKNWQKTGTYSKDFSTWGTQQGLDLFKNIKSGNGKAVLSNGNYYHMDNDTYDRYGKEYSNYRNTKSYSSDFGKWANNDDLNVYKAIRSSQDDYTNSFDDFRYSLNDEVLEQVRNDWKAGYGTTNYYNMDDPDDLARQAKGIMPKYTESKYNLNDAYGRFLYENELPYNLSTFSKNYDKALDKWKEQQEEKTASENNYNNLVNVYIQARLSGQSPDDALKGIYDSGEYDFTNFTKGPKSTKASADGIPSLLQSAEDYIADAIKMQKSEEKNPYQFTAGDLEKAYTSDDKANEWKMAMVNEPYARRMAEGKLPGGALGKVEDENGNLVNYGTGTALGAVDTLKAVQEIDNEFHKNSKNLFGLKDPNGRYWYDREYLQSKEYKDLLSQREQLLESVGMKKTASEAEVQEMMRNFQLVQAKTSEQTIVKSGNFSKSEWQFKEPDTKGWSTHGKLINDGINGLFYAQNSVQAIMQQLTSGADPARDQAIVMTSQEKAVFNYLASTQGESVAVEYFDALIPQLNNRLLEKEKKTEQNIEDLYGDVGKTLYGSMTQIQQAIGGYSMYLGDRFGNQTPYFNDPRAKWSRMASEMRADVSKDFSDAGKFWYENLASFTDNAVRSMTMGKLGLAVMAGNVYASKQQELLGKGVPPDQARLGGFLSSFYEVLTEYASLDNVMELVKGKSVEEAAEKGLKKIIHESSLYKNATNFLSLENLFGAIASETVDETVKKATEKTFTKAIKDILWQVGCEASEEVASEILNDFTYSVNTLGENEYQSRISDLVAMGTPEAEARKKVANDIFVETVLAGAGGGLSGLGFGGAGTAIGSIRTSEATKNYRADAIQNGTLNNIITTNLQEDMATIGMSDDDIGIVNEFRNQPVNWVSQEASNQFVEMADKVHKIANAIKSMEADASLAKKESADRLNKVFTKVTEARERYQTAYQNGDLNGMQIAIKIENVALNDYLNAQSNENLKLDAKAKKRTERSDSLMLDLRNAMDGLRAFKDSETEFQIAKAQQIENEAKASQMVNDARNGNGLVNKLYQTVDSETAAQAMTDQQRIIQGIETLRNEIAKSARQFGIRSLNDNQRYNEAILELQRRMAEGEDYSDALEEVVNSVLSSQINYTSFGQFDDEMATDIRNRIKEAKFARNDDTVSTEIYQGTRNLKWAKKNSGDGIQIDAFYQELRELYPGLPDYQNTEDIAQYLSSVMRDTGKTYGSLKSFLNSSDNKTGASIEDVMSVVGDAINSFTEANTDSISNLQSQAQKYNAGQENIAEEVLYGEKADDLYNDRQGRQQEGTAEFGIDGRFQEGGKATAKLSVGSNEVTQAHTEESRRGLSELQDSINDAFGDNPLHEVNEISKDTQKALNRAKGQFGNRVVRFFEYDSDANRENRPKGGNNNGLIFVEHTGNALIDTFNALHENGHSENNERLYKIILDSESGQSVLDAYRKHTNKVGSDADVLEELVCDMHGNLGCALYGNDVIPSSVFVGDGLESAWDELQSIVWANIMTAEDSMESDEEVTSKNAIKNSFSTTNVSEAENRYNDLLEQSRSIKDRIKDLQKQRDSITNTEEYNNVIDALLNNRGDDLSKNAEEFEATSGLRDISNTLYDLKAQERALMEETDSAYNEWKKAVDDENIAKSGLTEQEYRRKEAVKEFGYTPYFYDAGYLLPNGQMLNFSGEKGKHYGIRGEDHRRIGILYEWVDSGTQAMDMFINDGNIRVMAESPGIDIAYGVEPTNEQYSKIRQMANKYAEEEYFIVDFSDENGYTKGSLEYEGKVSGEKVVNDIKHYFETGELNEQDEITKFLFSTTFLTPEQEAQRYVDRSVSAARNRAEARVEQQRQANQIYNEVMLNNDYDISVDDSLFTVYQRMADSGRSNADIQQVLGMTERMLLKNGYDVGGKLSDAKMTDISEDAGKWQKITAAAFQSPLRMFQNVAEWRDTNVSDETARTNAIIQNAKSSRELSDTYFMYKEQQLMRKNQLMQDYGNRIDSIDANKEESVLAQMIGEGIITEAEARASVADGKHILIPKGDGAIVTDKKGRFRFVADGETFYEYSDNFIKKKMELSREIREIRNNNPENADELIADAKRKSGMPLETPGAFKCVRTGENSFKIVDALGEEKFSITGNGVNVDKSMQLVNELNGIYGDMYGMVQRSLVTNGYAPIGKIERYFPHFTQQRDGLAGFMDYLHSEDLPIDIAGLTETFSPGKPWARNLLSRLGNRTDYDAVEGFNRYLNSVSDVIYMTPVIQRFRQLENVLRTGQVGNDSYSTNQNNSNFVVWMHDYTNQLANKKHSLDRGAETVAGRKFYTAVSKLMGLTGGSSIAMNIRTGLSNLGALAQASGIVNPKYTARAIADVVTNADDGLDESIPFVFNRVNSAEEIQTGTRDKAKAKVQNALYWWMQAVDDFTTKTVARAKYYELLDKGYSNETAINETSKWCTNLFADRSKGSRATIFTSKLLSPFTQFQLEPYNQLWHYTDIHNANVREQAMAALEQNNGQIEGINFNELAKYLSKASIARKDIKKLFGRVIATSMFGAIMRLLTGRDTTWNLGGIVYDVIQGAKKNGAEGAVNALKDDVLDNIPFSSVVEGLLNVFNEDYQSTNNPITATVSNLVSAGKKVLGANDVGDVAEGISYFVPGGSQIRKSIGGIDAYNKGGAYTAKGDKLRYPIEQNPFNFMKAVLFGKSALQPQNYDYSTDLLGANETQAYETLVENGVDRQEAYDFFLNDYLTYARSDDSTKKAAILTSGLDSRTQDLIAGVLGIELGTKEQVRQELKDFEAETEAKHEKGTGHGGISDKTYNTRMDAIDYYMEMLE